MKGIQLELMVDILIPDSWDRVPRKGSPLGCGQVLDCMETERGEIRNASCFFSMPFCPKGMGSVCTYRDPPHGLLQLVCGTEQSFFSFRDREDTVIVAGDPTDIHRDHGLCMLCDCFLQCIIIHFQGIWLGIHQDRTGSYMADHRGGSRIGICRGDHFVSRSDPQNTQGHFCTGSLRV